MQLMSPLIRVYEDRVRELETVLGKSAGLAEQAAALANENEALREELLQKSEHITQLQNREYLGGSDIFKFFIKYDLGTGGSYFFK